MSTELPDRDGAVTYLTGLLNKTLRIHTSDGRRFSGQLKCTDKDRNVILAMTHEYRQPTAREVEVSKAAHVLAIKSGPFQVDLKRRFVGLVVVPGQYITKIEIPDFTR